MSEPEKTVNKVVRFDRKTRRWFSFSLRTLLIFFAVVAALLHFWIIPSERQRRACDEILQHGGLVDLKGFEFPNRQHRLYPKPLTFKWFHHYYYHVDRILIRVNPQITDWNVFPKLDSIAIHSDKVEELLQCNLMPERIVHISIGSNNPMNSDWFPLITRYQNLESVHINGLIYVRDENTLHGFLELPKLEQISIEQLMVLKPENSSFQGAFNIIEKIKSEKPGSSISTSFFKTQ